MSSSGPLVQFAIESNADELLVDSENTDELFEDFKKNTRMVKTTTQISFENSPILYSDNNGENTYITNNMADRSEDLLTDVYFCCELPEIYSNRQLRFKWVKNIGLSLLKQVDFKINDNTIQKYTSDWLNIWYDLSIDKVKFDNIIGNTGNLNNPTIYNNKKVIIKNNKFNYTLYPNSSQENNIPSIPKTKLTIPLNFWFTKELKSALPMAYFDTISVKISVTLEDVEKLYTLYSEELEQDISPLLYNELYNKNYKIADFLKTELKDNVINLNAYIQKQGYALPLSELSRLVGMRSKKYIFNDVQEIESSLLLNTNVQTIDLEAPPKPIKEIVWVLRREDSKTNFNNHINFTGSYNTNNTYDILNHATFKIGKVFKVFEELDSSFLSYATTFTSHTKLPTISNIYVYSFAKNPEGVDSSGHLNLPNTNSKMLFKLNTFNDNDVNYNFNLKLHKIDRFKNIDKSLKEYKVKIFIVYYNFVTISVNDVQKIYN